MFQPDWTPTACKLIVINDSSIIPKDVIFICHLSVKYVNTIFVDRLDCDDYPKKNVGNH
jgi:hypothetical protein